MLAELTESLTLSGRSHEATALAEEVLARPHAAAIDHPLRLTLIAVLSLQRRADELIAHAQQALDGSPEISPRDRAMTSCNLTALGGAMDNQERYIGAVEVTTRAVDVAFDPPDVECATLQSDRLLADIQLLTAQVRLLRGESDEAVPQIEGGIEFAREHRDLITLPRLQAYLALVAAVRGDDAAAARALAPFTAELAGETSCYGLLLGDAQGMLDAVAIAQRSGRALDHTGACEDAAAVLAGHDERERARSLLGEAIDRYEALGATRLTARATARCELGGRRGSRGGRQRALTGWQSLTRSERAVAKLVAQGLTDREVGTRLFISPHTVNSHLRHAFQKLDVSTRTALAGKFTHSSDVSPQPPAQTAPRTVTQ